MQVIAMQPLLGPSQQGPQSQPAYVQAPSQQQAYTANDQAAMQPMAQAPLQQEASQGSYGAPQHSEQGRQTQDGQANGAAIPEQEPSAVRNFVGKLISLFRRGPPGGAQPAPGPLALPPPGGLLDQPGHSRNPSDATSLTYALAFMIHPPDPRIDNILYISFDRSFLTGIRPLPPREAAMRVSRLPKEELGIYTERRPLLNQDSLLKMEQRVAKEGYIDIGALRALIGPSEADEAAAAHGAGWRRRRHRTDSQTRRHEPADKQLVVGALPSLIEEEESPHDLPRESSPGIPTHTYPHTHASPHHHDHTPSAAYTPGFGHPTQPQVILPLPEHAYRQLLQPSLAPPLPPPPGLQPAGAPPTGLPPAGALITDPHTAWQALQYHQQGLMSVGALDPNHPNHGLLQAVNAAMQQMSAGGPMPAVGMDGLPVGAGAMQGAHGAPHRPHRPSPFLDEDGLLTYIADPVKAEKQRPSRRYDQDKETNRTYRRLPIVEGTIITATERAESYRLDIELGRMEFLVHPAMAQEDLLAARLLSAFKEFKRRETLGLATFYANKLAALEESLLASREKLFELSEQAAVAAAAGAPVAAAIAADGAAAPERAAAAAAVAEGCDMSDALRTALDTTAQLEKEVAETRQLKEEEEVFLIRAVETMQSLYASIQAERASQGYWRTQVELTVQQRPPEENQWAMGTGAPRGRLDALLLVCEVEAISGLPPPPQPFPPPPAFEGLPDTGFRPRRVETMCASHKVLVTQLRNRLNDLKGRPSSDPSDPLIMQLEDQIRALGVAPRRLGPRTAEQRTQALHAATQRVMAGDVGVPRLPRLLPILTAAPDPYTQGGQQGNSGQVPGGPHGPGAQPSVQGYSDVQRTRGPKPVPPRAKYYVQLYVNNHYVDTSQPVGLSEDYSAQFKDVFSVQVVRWPQSIRLQLYEKAAVRDQLLATLYVGIPGLSGSPHVDPRALPYQFTSQVPVRVRAGTGGQLSPPGSPGRDQGPGFGSVVYPSGAVYVRCGWVPQASVTSLEPGVRAFDNPLASSSPRDVEGGRCGVMPPVPHVAVDRLLRRAAERIGGKANRQQILKWLSHHKVDPNDPRNAPLVELLKAQEATSGGASDLFRLDVFSDIAIPETRQQGKRTSFLARRWTAGPFRDPERSVLKGLRHVRVPAVLSSRDAEEMEHLYLDALALVELVPGGSGPAIARAMHDRADRAARAQIGAELSRAIEDREGRIKQYALRIRAAANRIAGGKQAVRTYKTDDVVNDLPLPEFKLDLSSIARLVAPRRPLKRERKVLKALKTTVPADTELVITVQRATNLPQRRNVGTARTGAQRNKGRRGDDSDVIDQGPSHDAGSSGAGGINAFVEVRFRGVSDRTVTSSSDFPTFNETISLPVFGTAEEPSSRTLHENSDVITVNVFDEVIHDRQQDPRVLRTNKEDAISDPVRFPERERRFLGCVRIPLSAVYQMQILEGTFKLEVPPVVLGYTQKNDRPPCITLVLSLKPRLTPPPELPEHLLSGEMEDVTQYSRTWLSEVQSLTQCRTRTVRALAVDPDGTSLLVTRYVSPTHLPQHLVAAATSAPVNLPGVSHTEEVMLKAARFVSLLPYLEDSALQKRRVDVWSTNSECVGLAAGDAEEHAHLLAGYFLELGQQAFVVMGSGVFGAKCYFVLTTGQAEYGASRQQVFDWNELQLRLWNPLTGGVVSVKDVTGEMREVGAVYNYSNVWANIQVSGAPWEIHWNLMDNRMWKPLFGVVLPMRELGTVQTRVQYTEQPDLFYEQLETRVEEAARDALSKARAAGAFVTKPDNKISRVLKSLLRDMPQQIEAVSAASLAASLEVAQLGSSQAPPRLGNGLSERHRVIAALQEQHHERLARETRSDWVRGHILVIPFSDKYMDAVSEAVLNTGIHRIADEHVKYSVAALVEKGGASFFCCMWIYIAATR